jgi:hypothetical protein
MSFLIYNDIEMKKILIICVPFALIAGCASPRNSVENHPAKNSPQPDALPDNKENRFTKQFQQADSMFNQKYLLKMKTLDEKAAEYAASVVSCNKEAKECEGLIQTAYVLGAMKGELLGEETGTFGQALESLKRGHLVARKGWNGKGMFIFMRPEDSLPTNMIVNQVKSLPESFKRWVANNHGDSETDRIKFTAYLCMKAADGTIVNGWLASQTDMLANDWVIVE